MRKFTALFLALLLAIAAFPAIADSYSDLMEKAESYISSEDYTHAQSIPLWKRTPVLLKDGC